MSRDEPQLSESRVILPSNFASETYYSFPLIVNQPLGNQKYKFTGFKLLASFSSVVLSQLVVSRTIAQIIFKKMHEKSSNKQDKKIWVNRNVKHLFRTMIRYNSILFGSKVLLDEYYSETLRKNDAYYQSNYGVHYKIGALVGLITYVVNIPISEFQSIGAFNRHSPPGFSSIKAPQSRLTRLSQNSKQFLSLETLKRMLTSFNFVSLSTVILYRTIYFGVYQKVRSKYKGPLNQYLIAPIVCSSLSLIVSPLDQVKYLQMTSHKGKTFYQILLEKGLSLWNLSGQKIYATVAKQSLSMSFFVAGQNICKYFINNKTLNQ